MSYAAPQVVSDEKPSIEVRRTAIEMLRFTRAHEWHPGKLPLLMGFGLSLALKHPEALRPYQIVGWYVTFSLFLAFAYMLNNVSDLKLDAQVGKVIELKNWSPQGKAILSLGVGTAALLFGTIILPLRALPVLGLCFLLAWVYSFPPRFKENVILGPLVASMGQLSAPAAVILVAWGQFSIVAMVYVIVVSLYGLRMILVHQLLDMENDIYTGTVTTAIVLGRVRTKRLIGAVLVFEVIGSTILLAILLKEGMPPLLLLLLLLPLFRLAIQLASGDKVRLDSYTYIPLADFHESVLPLMLAVSLGVLSGGRLWWLSVLLLVVFLRRHRDRLLPPWYVLKGGSVG